MKRRKLFLLVSEDLEGIVFSTKGSRSGYCSSKKPSINYDYLSKIGVQPDIPYSMLEYNRRVSAYLKSESLGLEKVITEKTPPLLEKYVRKLVDIAEKIEKLPDNTWLAGKKHIKSK